MSASLAHVRPVHFGATRPDAARITAISAAIALNLAVIIIASRPLMPESLRVLQPVVPAPLMRLIEAVKPIPLPPVQLKPLPHPLTVPRLQPHPAAVIAPAVVVFEPSAMPTIAPVVADTATSADPLAAVAAPAVEASLAYRAAPLHFPVDALRRGMQGTVMLRVLVDEQGKPLAVTVEHGSGYTLLDRSAREQVLAGWLFQPAIVNGTAVRAWARVPVSFNLQ